MFAPVEGFYRYHGHPEGTLRIFQNIFCPDELVKEIMVGTFNGGRPHYL